MTPSNPWHPSCITSSSRVARWEGRSNGEMCGVGNLGRFESGRVHVFFFDRKYGDRLGNNSWYSKAVRISKKNTGSDAYLRDAYQTSTCSDVLWHRSYFLNSFRCSDTVQSNERRIQKGGFSPSCRSGGPMKQPAFWPFSTTCLVWQYKKMYIRALTISDIC